MVKNYPGEYELRFNYEVEGLAHRTSHSLELTSSPLIGVDLTLISALTPDGSNPTVDTWIETFLTEIGKQFNPANASFGIVELWRYQPQSEEADFISSYNPTAQPTSGASNILMQQSTYSFRSSFGGIMKIVLLETVNDAFTQDVYPTNFNNPNSLFELITDASVCPIIARDNGRIVSGYRMSNGQNEKVFEKRHRT